MSYLYRGPFKNASYQVLIHLARRFQRRRFFRNQPIRNKNGLWRPCLLTDQDERSNLYRGPSIDVSYQVSFGQAVSEETIFLNWPIRNKNCLWRPCLLMDREKISNFIEDLPQMLSTKFQFIWESGFRDLLEINQSEKRMACGGHVC
jgi:hypothetical protein